MKKINFFAMVLAAVAIVSCSKEKMGGDNNGQPPVVEGVETYATFSFSVDGGNTATKGASETDLNKINLQDKVNNITVTIFKVGTPSILEAVGYFEDKGTTGIITGDPIKLTSGAKRIFVFANKKGLTTFPELKLGITTLEDCYMSTIKPTKGATFSLATLTAVGNYYMSNIRTVSSLKNLLPNITSAASKPTVGDQTENILFNRFVFTIQKSVAKVEATLANVDVVKVAGTITTSGASLSGLLYTVKNINTEITPVQLFANIDITDAEAGLPTQLPWAAYYSDFSATNTNLKDPTIYANKYSILNDIDQALKAAPFTGNAVFATENTNAVQVYGNTSYLAVKGKYKPDEVLASCGYASDLNDGNFTPLKATTPNTAGDFWKVDLKELNHQGSPTADKLTNTLFDTEKGATDLVKLVLLNDNGQKDVTPADKTALEVAAKTYITKYTGGMAYYRLNIGVTIAAITNPVAVPARTIFGIKRNSIYKVSITKINKLGASSENDLNLDPDTPVTSQDTYVTATVKVEPWLGIPQSGEL